MAATAAPFPMTRARVAALVIGVPVCLALVAYNGLDLVANIGEAHYPVSYAIPAGARSLNVSVAAGHLTIRPATASQATLTGTARYSLVRSTLTEQATGSGTTVRYHCAIPVGDCQLDATITVPGALPVKADTGGGDAIVTGTAGTVALSTGGGNIAADHTSGSLALSTSGGDINATAVRSPAVTATSGGGTIEIDFATVPGDVTVDTSGGDITLVLPAGDTHYRVITHTSGGGVSTTVPVDSTSAHQITATTGGGNITIRQQ